MLSEACCTGCGSPCACRRITSALVASNPVLRIQAGFVRGGWAGVRLAQLCAAHIVVVAIYESVA